MANKRKDNPPPLDYSNVPPEEDGRPYYTPPPGWTPPTPGAPLPNFEGIDQEYFNAAIREQLLPNEGFWRRHASHKGFRAFIKDKSEAERALLAEAFQLELNTDCPTLDDCIPTGSVIEAVDRYFWEFTDIPRELPFFYVMHYVLATLLQRGVQIHKGKQVILPDLWTIVVAGSGAGKTLSQRNLDKALSGEINLFSDAMTSLQFLTNLRDQRLALYIKDEFAQFLRAVAKETSMQNVRDYLLRTYDNGNIEHTTTKSSVKVENSAIGILGYTPTDTLKMHMTREMLLDGFAQRFSYCVAEKDERPIVGDYDFDNLSARVSPLWKKIISMPIHPVYKVSQDARLVFNQVVGTIVGKAREININDSFSRRLAFTTYKYGLAYHILAGKEDDTIDPDDLAQASKLVSLHLVSLRKILDMYEAPSKSPVGSTAPPSHGVKSTAPAAASQATPSGKDTLTKVRERLEKQRDTNSAPLTLSKLQGAIRALRGSAADTRTLATQVVAADPSLAPFVVI